MEELHVQTGQMDTERPNTADKTNGEELPALIMTTVTGGLKKKQLKLLEFLHIREDNARCQRANWDARTQTHTDGTIADITRPESWHAQTGIRVTHQIHQLKLKVPSEWANMEPAKKMPMDTPNASTSLMDTRNGNTAERVHGVKSLALTETIQIGGLKKMQLKNGVDKNGMLKPWHTKEDNVKKIDKAKSDAQTQMVTEWTIVDIRWMESSHAQIAQRTTVQMLQLHKTQHKNGGKPEDARRINQEELHAQITQMDTKRPNTAERAHGVKLLAQTETTVIGGLKKN